GFAQKCGGLSSIHTESIFSTPPPLVTGSPKPTPRYSRAFAHDGQFSVITTSFPWSIFGYQNQLVPCESGGGRFSCANNAAPSHEFENIVDHDPWRSSC